MPSDNFTMSENLGSFGMQQRQDRFDAIGDLIVGPPGPPGPQGPPGADGTVSFDELTPAQKESLRGEGVPAGGTTGQVLAKASNADYETEWIDAGGGASMTILSYGHSTWADFIAAYQANSIVYCRASISTDPSAGSQVRMAYMAYVNHPTVPTSVEFQYYRSMTSHSDDQQGDQIFIYTLTNTGAWTSSSRRAFTKIEAGTNMSSSYANGTLTLNATGGGGGTSDYDDLTDKPSINNVTLSGNKTAADLGLGTYTKPSGGIPKTDLASAVQTSLGKADSALQSVPSTYRTAAAQDAIDAGFAKTNEVAIVINGKRPGRNASAGQYVIVRNSTISGITDGLYVVKSGYTLSPSTDVTAASLSAVNIGGLNFLLSQIADSGWINLTLTSSFTLYNTTTAKARYRKIGNLVEVQGTIKPTDELTNGGGNTAIATLPTGYRPANDSRVFICQGTASNRWALTITANGVINISRYGVTEFITVPTSAWLPFDVMFFVD